MDDILLEDDLLTEDLQDNDSIKIKNVNLQLIAILGFVFSIILSFLLVYDEKLKLENKKRIFTDEEYKNLVLFQTILNLVLSFVFLYIVYVQNNNSNQDNNSYNNDFNLQISSSVLLVISAIIRLYLVLKNFNNIN